MSSTERPTMQPAATTSPPPDPTAGQAGDGPNQAGATNPGAAEGEGVDKSTDR